MAITPTVQVPYDGLNNAVVVMTGFADGQGGSEIKQVKVSAADLRPPAIPKVMKIIFCVTGGSVSLFWDDANDDHPLAVLSGQGEMCFEHFGGLLNPAPDPTGNILLSTQDFVPGSSYTISLEMRK
jgi:hypothetical protein